MADSIRPWLAEYLVDVGEQVGANLSNAPRNKKKKKVQLVEFLTYGLASQDDCLWAKISDKCHKIPVRFSRTAMDEYSRFNSKRLTEYKTAIVSIKDFKPFFARVPMPHGSGMSDKAHLALEIDYVSAIGSFGESQWGDPQDVEANGDLRQWSEGLRQHGGGGNVLMERKKQRPPRPDPIDPVSEQRRALLAPAPKKRNEASSKTSSKPLIEHVDLLKKYERSWRAAIGDPAAYASAFKYAKAAASKAGGPSAASADVSASKALPQGLLSVDTSTRPDPGRRASSHVLDLGSSQPDPTPPSPNSLPDQERQTTPALEEWPASQRGSPHNSASQPAASQGHGQEPAIENIKSEDDIVFPSSFDYRLTPAQRLSPRIAFPSPPASSPAHPSHSPSLPPASPVSSPAAQPRTRPQVVRRVPYPVLPPPPQSSPSGAPRILAPNSDTSQGPSQSQSRSQAPCLSQEITQEDKCDESFVRSFLFTQVDGYEGDQSMPAGVDGLFTQAGGDVDSSFEVVDPSQEDVIAGDGKANNDQDQSVVPDSQEDQLEDDDAQIAESLFGPTQPYAADFSNAATNAKPVAEASAEDELPHFTSMRRDHDADENVKHLQGKNGRSSDHDPDVWKAPSFMRNANKRTKGKAKASSPTVLQQKSKTIPGDAGSTPSAISTRIAKQVHEIGDRSPRQSATPGKNKGSEPVPRETGSSKTVTANGRAMTSKHNIPEIDLRSVSLGSRKRSWVPEGSFDSVDGGSAKKRRTRDSFSIELEPASSRRVESEMGGRRKGEGHSAESPKKAVSVEAKMKLKDFAKRLGDTRPNLPSSAQYKPEEPPWISWPRLRDILLQTGRYRDKQAKEMNTKSKN